jgi:hypothetical protein
MLLTTALAYKIGQIEEVSRDDGGAWVMLRDGTRARLEAGQADYEHLLWLAEWSLPSRPVGVVLDASGRIFDLNAAHETSVARVRESPADRGVFRVAFWAYSPLCALKRAHPEFDRIHAALLAAAGTPQPLWVATHSRETVADGPDEDGSTAALPKILDVRPTSPPPSSNGGPCESADRPRG